MKSVIITNKVNMSVVIAVECGTTTLTVYDQRKRPPSTSETEQVEEEGRLTEKFRAKAIETIVLSSYEDKPEIHISYNGYDDWEAIKKTIHDLIVSAKKEVKEDRGVDNFSIKVGVSINTEGVR